jgi:hypothetical protein
MVVIFRYETELKKNKKRQLKNMNKKINAAKGKNNLKGRE